MYHQKLKLIILVGLTIISLAVICVNSDAAATTNTNNKNNKDKDNNELLKSNTNGGEEANKIQVVEDELRFKHLNKGERSKLDELRRRVGNLTTSSSSIFLSDRFLIKWLQARDFDLERAEAMFKQMLEWRKANNVDHILQEDFARWEKALPFLIDGVDKYGHMIYVIPAGKYDIRNGVISGHTDEILRYFTKQLEYGCQLGNNLTRSTHKNTDAKGVLILDMMGFNFRQHGCLSCIPLYIRGIIMYEANYPRIVDKLYVINAPAGVAEIFNVIKNAMSADSRNLIQIYGYDQSKWGPALLKQISPENLLVKYGGTKAMPSSSSSSTVTDNISGRFIGVRTGALI